MVEPVRQAATAAGRDARRPARPARPPEGPAHAGDQCRWFGGTDATIDAYVYAYIYVYGSEVVPVIDV
ncbi:hypothetical protein [Streptomyces roseolus]|uniref:hypothetical protein n=1 Tax=Streptomyces roseolus TaxID=67358 RepID=UPI0037941D28